MKPKVLLRSSSRAYDVRRLEELAEKLMQKALMDGAKPSDIELKITQDGSMITFYVVYFTEE